MTAIHTRQSPFTPEFASKPARMAEPKQEVRTAGSPPPFDGESTSHTGLTLLELEEQYLRNNLESLTTREREVMIAICLGGTNEAIASRLCIALPTLRTHLMRLNQKLGTTSKGDVIRHAASILIEGYRRGHLSPVGAA